MTPDEVAIRLRGHPRLAALHLLVLHGSRARGDARPNSDWDFGVLASEPPDLGAITTALVVELGTDAVDVVDLRHASALLRFRAARDGIALLERPAGTFVDFRLEAVRFWCDAGPVIRAAHAGVLAALG